jgi:hypothetical protein
MLGRIKTKDNNKWRNEHDEGRVEKCARVQIRGRHWPFAGFNAAVAATVAAIPRILTIALKAPLFGLLVRD